MKQKIVIISQQYPFGRGENYLDRELNFFAQTYDEIHLYPLFFKGEERLVNNQTFVSKLFENKAKRVKKSYLLTHFRLIFHILWLEFKNTQVKGYFIKNIKSITSQLIIKIDDAMLFYTELLAKDLLKSDIYSVWMDEGALMCAILHKKGLIGDFNFRLHGYDLYDERREGNYMPFRFFCFQQAKSIFIVSKAGKTYLENKRLFPDKLIVNYSGLYDHGLNPKQVQDANFVICSCSNVISIKRVHKIAEALQKVAFPVKWIHIGDGDQMNLLQNQVSKLPANISVELKGFLSNAQVMEIYTTIPIDLFVHVSETEGLPLSLVEAMSAGIPVLATDAGGTGEVVNQNTGELIPVDFDIELLQEKIEKFRNDSSYWHSKRKGARQNYVDYFDAEKNYPEFVKTIKSYP